MEKLNRGQIIIVCRADGEKTLHGSAVVLGMNTACNGKIDLGLGRIFVLVMYGAY